MDIRIGIQNSPREISFESNDSVDSVESTIASAVSAHSVIRLTDVKGSVYLVPADTLAYVELGTEETRRVGFVA
ncbi:MAG: DUF3107 domain-containing protein [Microbacteriaceae bacterium]